MAQSGKLFIPSAFRFTQVTPAISWTLVHNLGGNGSQGVPIVDVFITVDGVVTKIIPMSVTVVDKNTIIIGFSVARSGTAIVIV